MRTVAIICEYNPFHNGHLYQIEEIRREFGEDTAIIAVMSGNYVQRGELAIIDKWKRAELACLGGVNLVLELPFPYSASSAEFFARAGVHIAVNAGAEVISFGSENGDITKLRIAAENMTSPEFLALFEELSSDKATKSLGHPRLCELAYSRLYGEGCEELFTPNNILAIEYIKAISKYENAPAVHTVKRVGAGFNEERIVAGRLQSATAIRSAMRENAFTASEFIPNSVKSVYLSALEANELPCDEERLASAVLTHFRLSNPADTSVFHDTAGGLYNRLVSKSFEATGISSLTELCATKKYTAARIRRAIWFSLLGVTSSDVRELPEYSQLLACDTVGQHLLKRIKKMAKFPILTKPSADDSLPFSARGQKLLSDKADSLFQLSRPNKVHGNASLKSTPFVKKEAEVR